MLSQGMGHAVQKCYITSIHCKNILLGGEKIHMTITLAKKSYRPMWSFVLCSPRGEKGCDGGCKGLKIKSLVQVEFLKEKKEKKKKKGFCITNQKSSNTEA